MTTCSTGCGDAGTGGSAVNFDLALRGASSSGPDPRRFTTSTGWEVTLERALISIGPISLYANPPPVAGAPRTRSLSGRLWDVLVPDAQAHPGHNHFYGGELRGEWLGQVVLDAANPDEVELGTTSGVAGEARAFSLMLDPPRDETAGGEPLGADGSAHVAGVAVKGEQRITFEGSLFLDPSQGQYKSLRRVDGIEMNATMREGTRVVIEVKPDRWLDGAEFDQLAPSVEDGGRRLITPTSQPAIAWFLGVRSPFAFAAKNP